MMDEFISLARLSSVHFSVAY